MDQIDNSHEPALHAMRRTVSFATLGCKTNQFESAAMQESMQSAGYQLVDFAAGAELVIVNTCTVTAATDAQSRKLIRKARRLNKSCRVIVTGCYAQVDPDALTDLPGVSLVVGNDEKQRLLEFLKADEHLKDEQTQTSVSVSDIRQAKTVCLPPLTSFKGRSRAFVQIQNGCDAFCSYCIIPYARGASRSAAPDEIVSRVASLVASGFQEVVLTGIHIGGYGADLNPSISLNGLINRILVETKPGRLRLGSIEPTELSDELLETIVSSEVVCSHLHIPLQAGDDETLKRMGRNYDVSFFRKLTEKVRAMLPDAAICLDVITGFPGETEQEFDNTFQLISDMQITDLHVFPYSKRPGTPAATFADQVPERISRDRAERLRTLAAEKHRAFAEGYIDRELEVVVESGMKSGLMKGVSQNYLDLLFEAESSLVGKRVTVRPRKWHNGALLAELVES